MKVSSHWTTWIYIVATCLVVSTSVGAQQTETIVKAGGTPSAAESLSACRHETNEMIQNSMIQQEIQSILETSVNMEFYSTCSTVDNKHEHDCTVSFAKVEHNLKGQCQQQEGTYLEEEHTVICTRRMQLTTMNHVDGHEEATTSIQVDHYHVHLVQFPVCLGKDCSLDVGRHISRQTVHRYQTLLQQHLMVEDQANGPVHWSCSYQTENNTPLPPRENAPLRDIFLEQEKLQEMLQSGQGEGTQSPTPQGDDGSDSSSNTRWPFVAATALSTALVSSWTLL